MLRYFKYSPNNAILITGYFGKLQESALIQLSQQFNASLIDMEYMNFWHRDSIRVKVIGGETICQMPFTLILYIYLTALLMTSNRKPIDSSTQMAIG